MRALFIATCAVIVLSAATVIGWTSKGPSAAPATKPGTHFISHKLANGTVVFEEVPDNGSLPDIAPAAGNETSSREPRYKYDPLTQTYRATRPDGSQHIIRDPLNPSKD